MMRSLFSIIIPSHLLSFYFNHLTATCIYVWGITQCCKEKWSAQLLFKGEVILTILASTTGNKLTPFFFFRSKDQM